MAASPNRLRPSGVAACGALGRYDPERVRAIASALEPEAAVVHSDQRSILALDRPPIRWQGARQRGLAWTERVDAVSERELESWHDAATTGAACGLVIEGRRRFVHTSVAGALKLYYLQHAGAVYFATSVHALASTSAERLSVDWDAWAAILTLDYPLGDRTPFAEIRVLSPYSTLSCRRGRARASLERWPWAEIEPERDLEPGTAALLERLRRGIGRLPSGPIVCQLSGGLDSRVCLALLAEQRRADTSALTADHDGGTDREIGVAAELARIATVPHQVVTGEFDRYWADLLQFSLRTDFQLVRQPWRVPKIDPLRRSNAPVVDGLAFDILAMPGERFFTKEAIEAGGTDAAARGFWKRMKEMQARRGPSALDPALARALWASSRRQLMAESRRFSGNPNRLVLTFYVSRLSRGIALSVFGSLGRELPMVTPFMDDAAARAALAIRPMEKYGARVYQELFAALLPEFEAVPSNSLEELPIGRRLPRRSQSPAAAEAFDELLRDGPLAPFVRPKIHRVLARHRAGKRGSRAPIAVLGPAVFHLWHRRYRNRLGDVDPTDVF